MAKANLAFTRIGADGYEYARRADGVWFFREGVCGQYGWVKTKWREVGTKEEDTYHISTGLAAHEAGETGYFVGFGSQIVITDGSGFRLPN